MWGQFHTHRLLILSLFLDTKTGKMEINLRQLSAFSIPFLFQLLKKNAVTSKRKPNEASVGSTTSRQSFLRSKGMPKPMDGQTRGGQAARFMKSGVQHSLKAKFYSEIVLRLCRFHHFLFGFSTNFLSWISPGNSSWNKEWFILHLQRIHVLRFHLKVFPALKKLEHGFNLFLIADLNLPRAQTFLDSFSEPAISVFSRK